MAIASAQPSSPEGLASARVRGGEPDGQGLRAQIDDEIVEALGAEGAEATDEDLVLGRRERTGEAPLDPAREQADDALLLALLFSLLVDPAFHDCFLRQQRGYHTAEPTLPLVGVRQHRHGYAELFHLPP